MATSSKPKPKSMKVGDVWTLPKGETIVTRPDGTSVTALRAHALDVPGVYTCGDVQVDAKAPAEPEAK